MTWILSAVPSGCGEMWWRSIPANESELAVRVEFFGDEIDRITEIDVLTGEIKGAAGAHRDLSGFPLCGAQGEDASGPAADIEKELEERVRYFKSEDKLLEAQRIARADEF